MVSLADQSHVWRLVERTSRILKGFLCTLGRVPEIMLGVVLEALRFVCFRMDDGQVLDFLS